MHKDKAYEHIKQNLSANEEMIGFFMAQSDLKFWLFVLIGPLAALSFKNYFIAVTNTGLHFHSLNLPGKFSQHDFFPYDAIDSGVIKKGKNRIPMKFKFDNGRKLKISAIKKGLKRTAKIDESTLQFLKENIQQTNIQQS